MAFSAGKIIVSMFILNMMFLGMDFTLDNSSIVYSFFTTSGSIGSIENQDTSSISFGTDTAKTGTEGTIQSDLQRLLGISSQNPIVAGFNFISQVIEGLLVVGAFFLLLVTYSTFGIIFFLITFNVPIILYVVFLPLQIIYLIAIYSVVKGGNF